VLLEKMLSKMRKTRIFLKKWFYYVKVSIFNIHASLVEVVSSEKGVLER
jgi:hypothetical protein